MKAIRQFKQFSLIDKTPEVQPHTHEDQETQKRPISLTFCCSYMSTEPNGYICLSQTKKYYY